MRPRLVRLAAVTVCAGIAACGAFGADDSVNPVTPVGEAGADAGLDDAAVAADGVGAADAADACAADNPAQSDFSSSTGWTARGNASVDAVNKLGLLTPEAPNNLGALWWSQRVHLDDFELSFQLRVRGGGSSSEGLAFAWTEALSVPTLGNAHTALGACGLPSGWGVLFSMVPQGSPSTSPVRVVETPLCTGTITLVPPMADGNWHPISIVVKAGLLDLSTDGLPRVTGAKVPNSKPGGVDGYWGFTGATSATSETHEVRAVKMTLTNQPLCTR
jgi:hypothetical protein